MATIKSYTDIDQSKKLAEILPLESADMYYEPSAGFRTEPSEAKFGDIEYAHPRSIRCWSLAALLGVLNKSAYFVNEAGIVELSSIKATKWCICILNCGKIKNCYADNPVDACVEMIEKLHELKML